MKVDTTKLMLFILVLIMGYNSFFKEVEVPEPTPVTVTLPESYGTTGLQQMDHFLYCRILHNLMNNDGRKPKEKEDCATAENLESVS